MAWTYEPMETFIPNTTMQRGYNDNHEHKVFTISPNVGYVLHDNNYDEEVIDTETLMPTGEIKLGYRTTTASCGYNYTFTPVQVFAVNGQTVAAYGSREFYALPTSEVLASQDYNGGNSLEIM